MADPITVEDAQKLLEQDFKSISNNEPVVTPAVVEEQTPEVVPTETQETTTEAIPEKPVEQSTAQETANSPDPYAWINDVPESVRDKVLAEINDKLGYKHQFESNKGRINAYQQKLLEAQRALAHRPSPQQPAAASAERQTPSTPEGWQQIMKSDPELASAVEARVKAEVESAVQALRSDIQEFKKTAVEPLYENAQQQYVEAQRAELKSLVSNYEEVISSPSYGEWLKSVASDGIRNLALNSTDARDAYYVLRQYADDMTRLGYVKPQQVATTQATTTTQAADTLAAERDAKLKSSTVVKAPAIAPAGGGIKTNFTKEDAEALFLEEYKKLTQRNP